MNSAGPARETQILMVEDNPDDVELAHEALAEAKVRNRLWVVGDGVEALAFLNKADGYEESPRPDIILLDLNMPRMNGREVLEKVKTDPRFKTIPVVVLTTSDSDEDILRSYQLNVNCYITKPVGFEDFIKVVKSIEDFWFTVVKLPKEE